MKKITMLFATVFAFTTSQALTTEEPIDTQVLKAFEIRFDGATDVSWTVEKNYYEAIFTQHNQKLYAFYGFDGKFIAVTRYILSSALPLRLHNNLKKLMDCYWITDLFEVASDEGRTYYVTLENADCKMVLESTTMSNWSVFQKDKQD